MFRETDVENKTPEEYLDLVTTCMFGQIYRGYTYYILGRCGPTGKTWLTEKLIEHGYRAVELEALNWLVFDLLRRNYVYIDRGTRSVYIILNKPLKLKPEPKEMTLEEIEKQLGHPVKVVNKS